MKHYTDECVKAYDSLQVMVLTGGESFIYGSKLEEILRHAKSYGLMTRVVTNGYWAKSYDIAYRKLGKLIDAGLTEINFSTGDDHLEFVPVETIKNATLASLSHNLTVSINVESGDDRRFSSKYLLNDTDLHEYILKGKLLIMNGIWIPYNCETESSGNITPKKYISLDSFSKCHNLFGGITIDPVHRMIACCGISAKNSKYLDLGDVRKHSIKNLYEEQFNDFVKIWLATEGAHKIMNFISDFTIVDPHYKREHSCCVCEKIFCNEQNLQILRNNYKQIYSSILLKYYIINKKESIQ
jgi:hypothetical protein